MPVFELSIEPSVITVIDVLDMPWVCAPALPVVNVAAEDEPAAVAVVLLNVATVFGVNVIPFTTFVVSPATPVNAEDAKVNIVPLTLAIVPLVPFTLLSTAVVDLLKDAAEPPLKVIPVTTVRLAACVCEFKL